MSVIAIAAAGAAEAGQTFPLVDGKTAAVIVGRDVMTPSRPTGPYCRNDAFLQSYIERSTGRKLAHVEEADYDPDTMPYAIFLGDTEAAKEKFADVFVGVDRDSYLICVTPNAVYLIGTRPHATQYAMADFLYRYLGIATYIPTAWGTIVPKHESVRIPLGLHFETPAFNARLYSGLRTYHEKPGGPIAYRSNTDIPWRMYARDAFHHALHSFITVKEFGHTHPEYFAEANGERVIASTAAGRAPCLSNPEVVKVIIQKTRAYFDDPRNKDKDTISLGPTDGGWCTCAQCKTVCGPDTTISQMYYHFLNQVARALQESHPTKSIGTLGYAGADLPPEGMRVERNIVPYICQTRASWADPDVVVRQLRQTFGWTSQVDKIGVYEYLYGGGYLIPRLYNRHLAAYLRAVRSQGVGGFYAEVYSNHGLDGPKAWVVERLLWNPYQDPDALRTRWCRAVFEEAAGPMDAYFALFEDALDRNLFSAPADGSGKTNRGGKFYLMGDTAQFELLTLDDVEGARSLLEEARTATKRPEIRERIDYFASAFRVTELLVRSHQGYKKAQQLHAAGAPAGEVLAALIAGDENAPDEDPGVLINRLVAKTPEMFTLTFPVSVSTPTEVSMRLIEATAHKKVHAAIKNWGRDRDALRAVATAAIAKVAPKDWKSDPQAKARVEMLQAMAGRIAVAKKVAAAPTIDGDVDDPQWVWQQQTPWWTWKSGVPYTRPARIAFCHDGKTLYIAFRCEQEGLDQAAKVEGYGVPAWKYISMEIFLNPDARDADPETVPFFQAIPALGGGLYAQRNDVVTAWKVTHADDHWQAELAIDLAAIGMTPDRFAALRMNLIRNTDEHGRHGVGWFPSSRAHKDHHARGWLVFEP